MNGQPRPADRRALGIAMLAVTLAAAVPYLPTVNNYFVRDDFGVVQLLASKPADYFPRWFVSSWMDEIWGHVPDEVRPFPAVSYQLTAIGGAASPFLHHALNIALHAANGLLVLAMGLMVAGLGVPAAAFGAVVFVLLPVHGESVAWITGRVDTMPALFYVAAFLAYVGSRQRRGNPGTWYVASLVLFFVALFTKQNTITMVGTLVAYDYLIARDTIRGMLRGWLRYAPFVLLTAGYLLLRYVLFGQVARENQLPPDAVRGFFTLVRHHVAHVVAGAATAEAAAWAVLAVVAGALAWAGRGGRPPHADIWRGALFFGPIWWIIGVAPIAVAGYESPRHVYLAAAGWAVLLALVAGRAWTAAGTRLRPVVIAACAVVLGFYAIELAGVVGLWNRMSGVSHTAMRDVRAEALSLPEGSLLIVGAPTRSWEWAVPFVVRPPFTRTDLTQRVTIVTPWLLHCCRSQWFDDTRRLIAGWRTAHPDKPIVVMRWDPDTGALARLTDAEYPALRTLVPALLDIQTLGALDQTMLRIVQLAPERRP